LVGERLRKGVALDQLLPQHFDVAAVEAGLFDLYRFHRIAEKTEAAFEW